MEDKVDKLTTKVEQQKIADGHGVLDKVEDVVRMKLQDDKEEEYELQRRKSNSIIYGLTASLEEEVGKQQEEDTGKLAEMLKP